MDWYISSLKSLGWVEVTLWATIGGQYSHNHMEFGHSILDKPAGDSMQTKIWRGQKWSKQLTYAIASSNPLRINP